MRNASEGKLDFDFDSDFHFLVSSTFSLQGAARRPRRDRERDRERRLSYTLAPLFFSVCPPSVSQKKEMASPPPTLHGPALVALPARIAAALSGQPQPLVPPFTPGVTNATPRYLKLSAEGDVSMKFSGAVMNQGERGE